MKVFADTNFFTNLWFKLNHTEKAEELARELSPVTWILPVTRLLRMELTNAMQRLVYETRHGSQPIRVTREAVLAVTAEFEAELEVGSLKWSAIPDDTLESGFNRIVYRHTAKEGFGTNDISHVASALILGCDTFWSFDIKARKLAQLEGLKLNPWQPV